jgi:Zn-dependent protease
MLFQLDPQVMVLLAFALLFALTFHEFSHAAVAYLCGDSTAKMQGRLSVNPLVHLDLFGSLMILFIGFGYAKPVPVNPRNFRVRNADMYVAAAGPLMNLLLAIVGGILIGVSYRSGWSTIGDFPVSELLIWFSLINMNLCLFNLLPIGPLDGSYVWPNFLPPAPRRKYEFWNVQYGTGLLMVLVMIGIVLPNLSPFRWIAEASRSFVSWLV